jgi:transcription elongation factor GreA
LVANRPVIAVKVSNVREEGDLKEGGGYQAALEEQIELEARIRQLQELLRVAKVGEAPAQSGIAAPGMVVTVRYENDDETETFLLGSPEKVAHGDLEVYAPNSPLGKAIIGAHEGERRHYELPNGGLMTVALVKAEPYNTLLDKPAQPLGPLRKDVNREGRNPSRKLLRTAPLSIYTSSDDPPTKLVEAVHDLLVDCDIEIANENPAQKGS